ncbi:MAG: ADP-heptose--LPS heptosyltransferase, partial [Lentisphaeria bacterium]|nr:ADP-heptose--LPS heptosyltransferase [Lentisphaeria bacterium]NQZ69500.1 ADP-heptose--LPS heptosyltransferase [Lentisphaeria bacterium]
MSTIKERLANDSEPIKLLIKCYQSPGDILLLSAAIRDLHISYPNKFITDVRTPCVNIFENSPYITALDDDDPDCILLDAGYPLIHQSNQGSHHFIHGFRMDLEEKLGIPIKAGDMKGDIHLTDTEKGWISQIKEIEGNDIPFWIIDAGSKSDYTAKQWEIARFQELVYQLPEITFVQIGSPEHRHPQLFGDNLINLIGQTDLRQFIRLMYWAAGVITPVSFPMHLAAAVEVHPMYKRKSRPCIVIAGGREPSHWEAYPNHAYLHSCGKLSCCD